MPHATCQTATSPCSALAPIALLSHPLPALLPVVELALRHGLLAAFIEARLLLLRLSHNLSHQQRAFKALLFARCMSQHRKKYSSTGNELRIVDYDAGASTACLDRSDQGQLRFFRPSCLPNLDKTRQVFGGSSLPGHVSLGRSELSPPALEPSSASTPCHLSKGQRTRERDNHQQPRFIDIANSRLQLRRHYLDADLMVAIKRDIGKEVGIGTGTRMVRSWTVYDALVIWPSQWPSHRASFAPSCCISPSALCRWRSYDVPSVKFEEPVSLSLRPLFRTILAQEQLT